MIDKNMKIEGGRNSSFPRPRILVAVVIGSLFLVEVIIMNVFQKFAETAHGTMDAIILTTVLLPLLYFLIYRPLSRSVNDLKELSGTLERQVRERTIELEFSESLHRAVTTSSADSIVRINGDGVILMANPAAHRMFGYANGELENKHISLLLPEGHEKVLADAAAPANGADGPAAVPVAESVAVTRSGEKLTVECSSSECMVNGEPSFVIIMRDITERKKADEVLRESKARYRQLSEASFEGIVIAIGGKILDANDAFVRMFGYARGEIIGKTAFDISPPESHDIIMDHISRKSEEAYDALGLRKDGTVFPIEMQGRAILHNGQIARITAVRDITGRKLAEKALFESEARYRLISEASFEGIVINIDGKVVDCNSAFARMFGYAPDEIIGKVPFDLSPPESHAIILDHIRRESEEVYDVVARKKDGTLFNIEMRGRSIIYQGVKARITAMRDITGRVRAERAIRESEERLRATFDNSEIGMAFVGMDGRFERVNAALCHMFGYEEQELKGKPFQELTHPDDLQIGVEWLQKVARGEAKRLQVEKRYICRDGGVIWCSVIASVIRDAQGNLLHMFSTIVNITERKNAEKTIQLMSLFPKFNPAPVMRCDAYGVILMANPGALEVFGVGELHGVKIQAIIPELETVDLTEVIRQDSLVYVTAAVNKGHFQFALKGVAELGILSVYGSDITALKRIEGALLESENKYRALVEETSDWVWALDENGAFVYSSPQVLEITGYGVDEILGKTPFAHLAPEERERVLKFFHATTSTQKPFSSFEHTTLHKDGHPVVIETSGVPCFSAEGRFTGYRGINRDITDRKRAEEVLRKSNQLLDAIIENIPNMIFLKRASDLRFELFNRAGEALLGHDRNELLGRNDYDFFPAEQADFFTAKDRETLEKEDITDILEEPINTPSGTRILHTKKMTLRNTRGEPEYLLGISEDITDRKAAEDELRRAKEAAEEATTLKDKFISLVSHDLKTPLASMIGFLRLVRHDHGEPLSDGAKMILDRAAESGDAMVHLIEDLLTISRFKTGQLKLNRQFFDAEYLGAMMTANFAHLAMLKGIEIENTVPANYRIYGDKTLLAEAVQNLVTNAIKFCKSGDRITIAATEGDMPGICVRDTGPGINPSMLDDLFKFEKKTSTTGTAGETGTGFGLPLVKSIMELHGGNLKVDSGPGKGSVFSLNLPHVRPKILIVDDDRYSRYLQMHNLLTLNADILEADNGEAALDMIATVRPDLVITDIKMPVMDGLELLKRIKGAVETKDIPVIVISGEYGMEIRDTVFKFGGGDFVTKNRIDMVDFFPRIRRFIG